MAYLTLAKVKESLGIAAGDTADDALLADLITAAQAAIDARTGRTFEAATATRFYGMGDVRGRFLRLDADLLSVDSLVNGDGTTIAPADYALWPRNTLPARRILLRGSGYWAFSGFDAEISVTGSWGYATTAPAIIEQAAREYVEFLYRSPDARREGALGLNLPGHVLAMLGPFVQVT